MTSHIDLTLTLGQDLWISEHFMWHRLLKHFFPGSSQIFWFLSLCSQHSPSEQIPLLQIKCFLQVITNHCKPFSFLTISYQQEIFLCTQQRPNLVPKYGFKPWLKPLQNKKGQKNWGTREKSSLFPYKRTAFFSGTP